MKRAPRSLQHHVLYRKYNGQDSEISALLGKCGLKMCGDNLTRENVMKQAASLKAVSFEMLLPGITVSTSATDFAPIQQEQLQKFEGDRWVLFGEIYDSSKK